MVATPAHTQTSLSVDGGRASVFIPAGRPKAFDLSDTEIAAAFGRRAGDGLVEAWRAEEGKETFLLGVYADPETASMVSQADACAAQSAACRSVVANGVRGVEASFGQKTFQLTSRTYGVDGRVYHLVYRYAGAAPPPGTSGPASVFLTSLKLNRRGR